MLEAAVVITTIAWCHADEAWNFDKIECHKLKVHMYKILLALLCTLILLQECSMA